MVVHQDLHNKIFNVQYLSICVHYILHNDCFHTLRDLLELFVAKFTGQTESVVDAGAAQLILRSFLWALEGNYSVLICIIPSE